MFLIWSTSYILEQVLLILQIFSYQNYFSNIYLWFEFSELNNSVFSYICSTDTFHILLDSEILCQFWISLSYWEKQIINFKVLNKLYILIFDVYIKKLVETINSQIFVLYKSLKENKNHRWFGLLCFHSWFWFKYYL